MRPIWSVGSQEGFKEKFLAPGSYLYFWTAFTTASWLSLEYISLGPFSWIYGYSAGLETIPVHLALAKSGSTFSLWVPFIAGGLDRLSFFGNADPLNLEPLLFSHLPTWIANGLHMFLQRFVAIYFTARVWDEQLHLGQKWSVLAAMFHAGFSYFTVGFMLGQPAVPLLIWWLGRVQDLRRWPLWTVMGGLFFSTFTSLGQSVPYLIVFTVGWFAWVLRERSPKFYMSVALFFLALSMVKGPQILALVYNAPGSQRAGWPLDSLELSFKGMFYYELEFDFFAQDQFMRAISTLVPPAVLILGALVAWKHRGDRAECRLFLRVALLYAALSLKVLFVLMQSLVTHFFPWASGINMIRFHTTPAPFMVAAVMTLGLMVSLPLVSRSRPPLYLVSGVTGALLLFLLIWPKIGLFYPLMIESWGEKNYQVGALDELHRSDRDLFRVASVLPLQPAYAYGQGFETADGWANLYPAVYRQLWLRVLRPLFETKPDERSIFDPPGGRPQDHYVFLGSGGLIPGEDAARIPVDGLDIDARFNLHLLSLLNVKYLLSEYPLNSQMLKLVHARSSPEPVFVSRSPATGTLLIPGPNHREYSLERFPDRILKDLRDAVERRQRGKDVYIYENVCVLPRYRFVKQVKVAENGSQILDKMSEMTAEEMRDTAWVEMRDAGTLREMPPLSVGTVNVELYTPDEIRLSLDNKGAGLLVIANTWNQFWRAEVDGQPRVLILTNHAQFGLLTAPADRRVRLLYAPPYSLGVQAGKLFNYLPAGIKSILQVHDENAKNPRRSLGKFSGAKVCGLRYTPAPTIVDLVRTVPMRNKVNLALRGAARQSSTAEDGSADRAIDGNTNGDAAHNSVTHTEDELHPWWEVDLGAVRAISEIDVWNRTDCCGDRLKTFYVFVSEEPFTSRNPIATRWQAGVSTYYVPGQAGSSTRIPVNRKGRFVRVQLSGANYLSLAEVQVWGTVDSPEAAN